MRLDNIRNQYQRDLMPLTQQRETLAREIAELKAVRDVFLEETTALNARNEELAQLSAVYARRMDSLPEAPTKAYETTPRRDSLDRLRPQQSSQTTHILPHSVSSSTASSSTLSDESSETRYFKPPKPDMENPTPSKGKFRKWPGSKAKDPFPLPSVSDGKGKTRLEHNFQQLSVLRFARCDHCGDKMWGSQLRCTGIVHVPPIQTSASLTFLEPVAHPSMYDALLMFNHLVRTRIATGTNLNPYVCTITLYYFLKLNATPAPSLFGRDLAEQVRADSKDGERQVPVIVEKCIDAVEALGKQNPLVSFLSHAFC